MTRVNVGIDPSELCDQMLLAELRELPRCYSHRTDAGPEQFTLGKGHVLWCARYQLSLEERHGELWDEAYYKRGFTVTSPMLRAPTVITGLRWPFYESLRARPLLIARIRERLSQMKRKPRWTNVQPPEWAKP